MFRQILSSRYIGYLIVEAPSALCCYNSVRGGVLASPAIRGTMKWLRRPLEEMESARENPPALPRRCLRPGAVPRDGRRGGTDGRGDDRPARFRGGRVDRAGRRGSVLELQGRG